MTSALITGIGIVSSLGVGREALFAAIRENRAGLGDLTLFEPPGACEHAGEIEELDWKSFCFSKQTYTDRCTGLAMVAARLCLEDGGLKTPYPDDEPPVGVAFGTRWGCVGSAETFYEPLAQGRGKRSSSLVFSHSYPNCPTSFFSIELGLRGYSTSFAGDNAAGLWALRSATDALASGAAERVLAGATDALSLASMAHFEANSLLPNTRNQTPPESGTEIHGSLWESIPGEAGIFFLLETPEAAENRKAHPLAEITIEEESSAPPATHDLRQGNLQAAQPLFDIVSAIACTKTKSLVVSCNVENSPCAIVQLP